MLNKVEGGFGKTLLTVQALRAIAAAMVVLHHLLTVIKQHSSHGTAGQWMGGTTGVDLFFVISGLVMVTSSSGLATKHKARTFLLRRIERIVPPYWVLTTIKVLLVLTIPAVFMKGLGSHWHIAASYLFLPAFNDGDYFPVLLAGWTLTFEMLFYFLFAAALALSWPLIGFLSVTICLVAAGGVFVHPGGPGLVRLFDPIVLEFLYGVLLGYVVKAKRLPQRSICLVLLIGGGATLMCLASHQSMWARPFACGLPAFAVVAGAVGLEGYARDRLPLWLLELGDSSYSLYLTHGLVIPVLFVFITRIRLTTPLETVGSVALEMFVCIAVGELFYRLVELRIIRFFRGRRRAAVPVVA